MDKDYEKHLFDRIDRCFRKVTALRDVIKELEEESGMLQDENIKMADFLLKDDYTNDDVDNIAKGFPIDKGGD
jgi:hypothetical protein